MGPFEGVIMGDYDLLLGKRTYDIFSGYWPYNQDDPIGAKFQHINKYVLTHSDEPLAWDNSHRLSGDTAEAVAQLFGLGLLGQRSLQPLVVQRPAARAEGPVAQAEAEQDEEGGGGHGPAYDDGRLAMIGHALAV